jgi:hypothetical protein
VSQKFCECQEVDFLQAEIFAKNSQTYSCKMLYENMFSNNRRKCDEKKNIFA